MAAKKYRRSEGNNTDHFGDNFEVTFDGDLSDILELYNQQDKPVRKKSTKEKQPKRRKYSTYDDDYNGTDYYDDDIYDHGYNYDSDDSDDYDNYDEEDSVSPKRPRTDGAQRRDQRDKGKRRSLPNLLSPLKKAAQTGGKAAASIVQKTLRAATLILTIIIMAVIAINFWKNYSIYGSLRTIAAEKNYALGAFLGVGIFLLLFELIALFRSMSSQRIRKGNRNYRLDVGRGLLPFIFISAGSYLASIFGNMIPQSPSALYGLKGGIALYGSLNSTLLVLATAGVICCILRRFLAR